MPKDYADQRYYNAGMGRFWSPDRGTANPGNPISWNRYAYAGGDPVNQIDPRGTNYVLVYGGWCWGGGENGGPYPCDIYRWNGVIGQAMAAPPGEDQGGAGDASEIYTEAFFSAVNALSDSDCAAIFNTNPDAKYHYAPGDVLTVMGLGANGYQTVPAGSYFGSIDFARMRLDYAAETVADPATSISTGANTVQAASATIYLQANPLSSGYYGAQTVQQLALTLIHELGHVYNDVYGLGGSKIVPDANANGDPNGGQDTNAKTLQDCHPK